MNQLADCLESIILITMKCIIKGTTLKPVLLCGQSCNIPFVCSNIPFLKGNITLLRFAVICNRFAKLSVKKTLRLAKCTEFATRYQDHLSINSNGCTVLDQAPLRGATLFIFSLIHLAQCACKIALARLNLATAVRAVGVQAWLICSPRTEHGEGHGERSGY